MDGLGLAEAVKQLRQEIAASMLAAQGEAVQFELGTIDLELQLGLTMKAGVKGEAKWVVVSFGAEAGGERTRTHKVKLTLTPIRKGGGRLAMR